MSQTPLLSIVAAVYNGEKFLAQFFECLEQQQLESYELILVNDGSTVSVLPSSSMSLRRSKASVPAGSTACHVTISMW